MNTNIFSRIKCRINEWEIVMRPIDLDYQKSVEPQNRRAGWLLLLAGIALMIEMGQSYKQLRHEQAVINHKLQTSVPHVDRAQKKVTYNFSAKDFETAQQIVRHLATPWSELFSGLESANLKNVAILSVEPDMQNGRIHITGEAKDYASVLTLIARLRAAQTFSEVFLLHREIKFDDPQHPLGFTLSMKWIQPA
ncbi:MAG: PilN domain-containing protein [Gallionella sp.]